jgi:hypothetical protein
MVDVRTEAATEPNPSVSRLAAALHSAQAQGLLRQPAAVRQLLLGIVKALATTVENNTREPEAARALRSLVYWDHFEMDIKEALLGAFAWVDPPLYAAVREVIDVTFRELKKAYHAP